MAFKLRFGKKGGRRGHGSRLWSAARAILSGFFMTVGLLLVLLSASELLVYFLDRSWLDNNGYMDWVRVPLMMFLLSIPFFLIHFLLNMDRYRWSSKLIGRLRSSKPPEEIETIDLE